DDLVSYRQLPLILHQIGPKFRDEEGPRGALLRGREFVMSDAYSFDIDEEGMRNSYNKFRALYTRIFTRVGLPEFIAVHADSGAIGGSGSAEFMAITTAKNVGQSDKLMTCDSCDYGGNVEKAVAIIPAPKESEVPAGLPPMSIEYTPKTRTVEELQ